MATRRPAPRQSGWLALSESSEVAVRNGSPDVWRSTVVARSALTWPPEPRSWLTLKSDDAWTGLSPGPWVPWAESFPDHCGFHLKRSSVSESALAYKSSLCDW